MLRVAWYVMPNFYLLLRALRLVVAAADEAHSSNDLACCCRAMPMAGAEAWAKELLQRSPTALKFFKYSFNADSAHIGGISNMAMDALGVILSN